MPQAPGTLSSPSRAGGHEIPAAMATFETGSTACAGLPVLTCCEKMDASKFTGIDPKRNKAGVLYLSEECPLLKMHMRSTTAAGAGGIQDNSLH